MQYRTVVLVDGENMVFRYQEMKDSGKEPRTNVEHLEDCFVWTPDVMKLMTMVDVVRVGYYTTVVGDDQKLEEVKEVISKAAFEFTALSGVPWQGTLVPYVYKKARKGAKTKSVDINLTIDALRYAHGTSIDQIILFSGDGDYIPLLREIMSRGKMVQVYAFSSGLNADLMYNADDLSIIDNSFFKATNET